MSSKICMSDKSWYLVYTKPKMESVAQENLERQAFTTYLPKIKVNKRRRGRYTSLIEPMFPRYLFILLNQVTDNWMPIRSTLGVANMVRFGGLPSQVPEYLISNLQANSDELGIATLPEKEFKQGDQVEIIEGPMQGCAAVFEKQVSQDRVAVLLDIVGKHTRILLSRHNLQTA